MAGSGSVPRVTGPDDPMGHSVGEKLKDSYKVLRPGEDALDILSAGLNGYGDFIIVGNGCQVIRIPDQERAKLAAYLLSPLLETEAVMAKVTNERIQAARSEREVPPQLRAQPKTAMPRGKGVVAKP